MELEKLKQILEASLMVANGPLSFDRINQLFIEDGDGAPSRDQLRTALEELENDYHHAGIELVRVGSGYRFQARSGVSDWINRLWDERRPRYSRALLETLAIVAYRQPITRGEIENIRGVAVSTNIMRTLLEREWVRIVGHRDVPGKPAVYATTKIFLDYFNLGSLDDLPSLAELKDIDDINADLFADVNEPNVNGAELPADAEELPPASEDDEPVAPYDETRIGVSGPQAVADDADVVKVVGDADSEAVDEPPEIPSGAAPDPDIAAKTG